MTELQKDWVLRKRGCFYRSNSQGYTRSIHEAGRYSEDEAKAHAAKGIEPRVTAHPASQFLAFDDVPDERLVERAVRGARPRKGRVPRWSAVADAFALGSTYATQLCRRFNIDPDQQVGRNGVVR